MARYICPVCGYVHDDADGEPFGNLPSSWRCPVCGAPKRKFELDENNSNDTRTEPSPSATPTVGGGAKRQSRGAITQRLLKAHRIFGYCFLLIYLVLMIQMVPRLWTYQIEFPARTVVHISLGMAVGVMLLLKIAIVRFFRKLDQALVPTLGTWLLICSVVLVGISIPAAFREAIATAHLFTAGNLVRVERLLQHAGLEKADAARYSTSRALRDGQRILRHECMNCHDLRTVLAKPRTPSLWRQTVSRMAQRMALINPLNNDEQWQVTAYLTALSPQLQKSTQQLNQQKQKRAKALQAAEAIITPQEQENTQSYDAEEAKALVAKKCSQCHDASLVASAPPANEEAARQLVATMVEEGLDASDSELSLIVEYLTKTYVK